MHESESYHILIYSGRSGLLYGVYVDSPLCWAAAVRNDGPISSLNDLSAMPTIRVGISRFGSGSHSMAFYLAQLYDVNPSCIEFVVLNNFKGLRDGE